MLLIILSTAPLVKNPRYLENDGFVVRTRRLCFDNEAAPEAGGGLSLEH